MQEWLNWRDNHRKELLSSTSEASAVGLYFLENNSNVFILEKNNFQFEFSSEKTEDCIAEIRATKNSLYFTEKNKLDIELTLQTNVSEWLDVELSDFVVREDYLILNGFKRKGEEYMLLFLYNLKRENIHQYQKFMTFEYNLDFKIETSFISLSKSETIQIQTSSGKMAEMSKIGNLHFKIKEAEQSLTVFANDLQSQSILLIFGDATNGKETYKAGRYLNIDLPKKLIEYESGETMTTDFNFSFHPACYRSSAFNCLLPLERLNILIEAGERIGV